MGVSWSFFVCSFLYWNYCAGCTNFSPSGLRIHSFPDLTKLMKLTKLTELLKLTKLMKLTALMKLTELMELDFLPECVLCRWNEAASLMKKHKQLRCFINLVLASRYFLKLSVTGDVNLQVMWIYWRKLHFYPESQTIAKQFSRAGSINPEIYFYITYFL